MKRTIVVFTLLVATLSATRPVSSQTPSPWVTAQATLPVDSPPTTGAVRLVRGIAVRPDLVLRDGTIEFQLGAPTGSFAGLAFRMASTADYEIIYFAPSDDGTRWKSIQYQPVFEGETTWQLYYRDGYRAELPRTITGAIHVRLAIAGARADVYLNGATTPLLRIHDLKRDITSGAIGVWAVSPQATTASVEFSRLTTSPVVPMLDPLAPEHAPDTQLLRWHLSERRPSPGDADPPAHLPKLDFDRMTVAIGESSGVVNLTQVLGNPAGPQKVNVFGGAGWGLAYAHVSIESDASRTTRLFVSYSDGIGVYLNGERRFTGNNSDGAREPDSLGSLQTEMDGVDLPLKRGRNDLVLAITDKAFGWGFRARLESLAGLTVRP